VNEAPLFICALCHTPVYLISSAHKRFFFRHKIEDGSCPAVTRGNLSKEQIEALKYKGLKESAAHKRIKNLVERSLAADKSFEGVKSEGHWRGDIDPNSWRRPDVQAVGPDGRIAFEIQLSTTFLDLITGRRDFYRKEGGLLVWVLGSFDPGDRRLTTDDILVPNNSNALVVDEETTEVSERTGRMHVRCHYRRPVRDGDDIEDVWSEEIVAFGDLTCEQDSQRVWHFDYDSEAARIRSEIEEERKAALAVADDELRRNFVSFWKSFSPREFLSDEQQTQWNGMREQLRTRDIEVPERPEFDRDLVALMIGLVSAQTGKPVGWNFRSLVQVAHQIADSYPRQSFAFGYAVKEFDRSELLERQDRRGQWKAKARDLRERYAYDRMAFVPSDELIALVKFLYPAIGGKLEGLKKRADQQMEFHMDGESAAGQPTQVLGERTR
jgi:hypothetical protein